MSKTYRILVVNPGSTTTKMALFENEKMVAQKKVDHPAHQLDKYPNIIDQYPIRRQVMLDFLRAQSVDPRSIGAVVGRGGMLKALPSGTYKVCQRMVDHLSQAKFGAHASNIGAILAFGFHWDYGIPAFVVDPPVVDEMTDLARLSGLKEVPRRSLWHALNILAVVRQACQREQLDLKSENFVAVHLGGGISVVAIEKGRVIDVSNGLESGPYTPERAGTLPSIELAKLCFSGKYTEAEVKKLIAGKGGLVNYLGTSNIPEVERRILQGDDYAAMVFNGMAYQIAKEVGSYAVVLKGRVTRTIITGGAANSELLVSRVREYIDHLAPVVVIPGEDELSALALGGLRALRGEEAPRDYGVIADA